MKTIIAGSRGYNDFELLQRECGAHAITEVVSGGAKGADELGERYAQDSGIPVKRFPVSSDDWQRYGKAAGPMRNQKMAEYAEALIAFWDGSSRGTRNMIELAAKAHLKITVVMFDDLSPRAPTRARARVRAMKKDIKILLTAKK